MIRIASALVLDGDDRLLVTWSDGAAQRIVLARSVSPT